MERSSYRWVIVRDLVIFQVKVALDGLKGMFVIQLATLAALTDVLFPGSEPGHRFYWVLRLAERFDLWLNLYGAASSAERSDDGLFGASRAGADSLLGRLEAMVRGPGWDVA